MKANTVYTASLKFASAEGSDTFMIELDWEPSLRDVLNDAGGDETKLPEAYKAMLKILEKSLSQRTQIVDVTEDGIEAIVSVDNPLYRETVN